ncbi:MAG: 50S ribosomal protein L13 [Gammaproteobacteria bacterium]|nr:50S ribosomal protein L13 [Gammaproteobacteria bacterium]
MSTYNAKSESVKRDWFIINAEGLVLGRLASEVARRLRGKHKPEFTRHVDTGDYIIVTNIDKVKVTGNKLNAKIYYNHSGYPGGLKKTLLKDMPMQKAFERAIKGMLPKNPLGREMYRKLKVYTGLEHPHAAQQPQVLEIKE